MSKIPSDEILECLYKLRKREFALLNILLDVEDMGIYQKISMPIFSKIEDNGEKEHRSETLITKTLTPGTGESKQE